jgi:hypothetical protein
MTREFEVLELSGYGAAARQTYRGIERIQSRVLRDFEVSPELLSCW